MSNLQFAKTLSDALHLALPPVAMKFADVAPADVPMFAETAAAGCQFWQHAAARSFVTTARDHELCAIGTFTHNLEGTPAHEADRTVALKVFSDLGYVRPEDLALVPVLAKRHQYVVYGPLAEMAATPDLVMLFVHPGQQLILSEAVQQIEGQWMPAMGRPACAIVPQTMNTGRAALSLGCCGARAYLDALTDDIALYSIPGAKLAVYVERIAALVTANAVLTKFHTIRRQDVEAGGRPTIQESLVRLQG